MMEDPEIHFQISPGIEPDDVVRAVGSAKAREINEPRGHQVESAGRCVPFLRPHRWTPWEVVPVRTSVLGVRSSATASGQKRRCLRCGLTQLIPITG